MNIQTLRKKIRANKLLSKLYYGLKIDNYLFEHGKMDFGQKMDEAFKKYLSKEELANKTLIDQYKKDIIRCYKLYKSNADEYFLLKFKDITEEQKQTYVTDAYENSTLCQIVGRDKHDIQLNDKYNFYNLTKKYFKRSVMRVNCEADYSLFKKMALEINNLILKPNAASVGNGITSANIHTEEDAKKTFDEMISAGGEWIVEECIKQDKEMARWNASSVNTVRVSSFLTKKGFHVLSSIIRTGRAGSVIDNAGHGGISAAIDPETGIIASDGMDKRGGWYKTHPDSGANYKGYQIPRWKELIALTEEIHRTIPNQIYVGWDFALTENGWVLIEGNWGQLGAQQVALGHGLKPMFEKYLQEGVLQK